jgi:hypothetical protein
VRAYTPAHPRELYWLRALTKAESTTNADLEIKEIFSKHEKYLRLLKQSFGDLNKTKTAELSLIAFRQKRSVSEYDGGVAHSSIDGGSEAIYRPGHVPG